MGKSMLFQLFTLVRPQTSTDLFRFETGDAVSLVKRQSGRGAPVDTGGFRYHL
jgi:hypothetical protein